MLLTWRQAMNGMNFKYEMQVCLFHTAKSLYAPCLRNCFLAAEGSSPASLFLPLASGLLIAGNNDQTPLNYITKNQS